MRAAIVVVLSFALLAGFAFVTVDHAYATQKAPATGKPPHRKPR